MPCKIISSSFSLESATQSQTNYNKMIKFIVLAILFAVVAAKPGPGPAYYSAAPLAAAAPYYAAAPLAYSSSAYYRPALTYAAPYAYNSYNYRAPIAAAYSAYAAPATAYLH